MGEASLSNPPDGADSSRQSYKIFHNQHTNTNYHLVWVGEPCILQIYFLSFSVDRHLRPVKKSFHS
jgi:hypothetical protein